MRTSPDFVPPALGLVVCTAATERAARSARRYRRRIPDWQQAEQIEGLVGLALAVLVTGITNVLARLIWRQEYLDSAAIAIQSPQHRHGGLTKAIYIK